MCQHSTVLGPHCQNLVGTQGDTAQYDHEAASGATVTEEKILAMKRLDATVASYSLVRLLLTRA